MKERILKELRNLEEREKLKILYAVESGSRAWGFASNDSDYDVRFIYMRPVEWYLSLTEKKDTIDILLDGGLDLAGWDIRKALKLFQESNPPLLEWLRSPIIYLEETDFANKLRNLGKHFFQGKSAMYHYLAMAKNNWKSYFSDQIVKRKKYFYVLRPILACEWIRNKKEMAPMEFEKLLVLIKDKNLKKKILELLEQKRTGLELGKASRIKEIDEFLEIRIKFLDNDLKSMNEWGKEPEIEVLEDLFRNEVLHYNK